MEFSSGEGGGYLTFPRLATCLGSGGACLVTPLVECLEGLPWDLNQEVLCWKGLGHCCPHDWWSTYVQDQEVADKPLESPCYPS